MPRIAAPKGDASVDDMTSPRDGSQASRRGSGQVRPRSQVTVFIPPPFFLLSPPSKGQQGSIALSTNNDIVVFVEKPVVYTEMEDRLMSAKSPTELGTHFD